MGTAVLGHTTHRAKLTGPKPGRLGRYVIQEEIGRGMMGVVYGALDPDLGRPVALKSIELAFSVPEGEREQFERRFLAEARAAARLAHPGIVVVHDVGRDTGTGGLYIAMEYLEGRTLAQLTADGARLEWREASRIVARLAEALHHAHQSGIVHRDVKPANVMVLPTGQPKVMDFGVAKLPAAQLTSTGQLFGTPAYMSPEQLSGVPLDGRSDLFSLGAVLYRILTGQDAFAAASVPAVLGRIAHHDPPPPSTLVPGIPRAVDAVVARALAKSPADRYPDGQALAVELDHVRAGGDVAVPALSLPSVPAPGVALLPATTPPAAGRRRLGRRGLLAVAALGVAALGVALASWKALPLPALRPPVPPAHLAVELEHSLRTGTLKVWIDDELAFEEQLESRVVDDLVLFRTRRGRSQATLEVAPGEHVVRLEVTSDGFSGSRRIRGTFESGATRRLRAKAGGLLVKELSVWWAS